MVFDEFSIPSRETVTTTPKEWYIYIIYIYIYVQTLPDHVVSCGTNSTVVTFEAALLPDMVPP